MCGRYATSASNATLSELFDASDELNAELAPDYNVAPTGAAPIVRARPATGERVLSLGRWGLVPAWAKDTKSAARMINARAETVATSRVYAEPFARRRCLVPADGWYEWSRLDQGRAGARKQAYFMTRRDGGTLALAGIWGVWRRGDESRMTYSVLTTAAVGDLATVHDRMPLLLPRRAWDAWLGIGGGQRGDADGDAARRNVQEIEDPESVAASLLASPPIEFVAELEIRPVGPAVGDVRNGGPELVKRVTMPRLGEARDDTSIPTLF